MVAIRQLHLRLAEVAPVIGVSRNSKQGTVRIDYASTPTPKQLQAVSAILKDFDWSAPSEPTKSLEAEVAELRMEVASLKEVIGAGHTRKEKSSTEPIDKPKRVTKTRKRS